MMTRFFSALLSVMLVSLAMSCAESSLAQQGVPVFSSTYEQWKDPANNFVSYIDQYNQARVIFIGSSALSNDDDGQIPTVSEGMGYGLLLSYANNDQILFDKFLRYIIATANSHGCGLYNAQKQVCLAPSPFLMPWMVNEQGKPFWYKPSETGEATFTSGSASDADFQIAWAVHLASKRVKEGTWQNSTFDTIEGALTYDQLFQTMGKAIRLANVDLDALRYTPGNQWGLERTKTLHPGYFTPQAFDAFATLPLLDLSVNCSSTTTPQQPANALTLVYKNNLTHAVSIDYMGGAGIIIAGRKFIPKKNSTTGFTVSAVTIATAVSKSTDQYYNNMTFQATFYDENEQPLYKAHYEFEYKAVDGILAWRVTDKGSSPEAKMCLTDNVAHIFLTQPDIAKVNFDWSVVKTNSLLAIQTFQSTHDTGFFPNTIFFDSQYPDSSWNRSFAYDAIRFPLWSAPYAYVSAPEDKTSGLQRWMLWYLLSNHGLAPFVQPVKGDNTLPNEGIQVFTKTALGGYASAPPALNAPIALAAYLGNNPTLYNLLIGPVTAYQITQNQPKPTDPVGDSAPYFNAAMLLLTEAFFNNSL